MLPADAKVVLVNEPVTLGVEHFPAFVSVKPVAAGIGIPALHQKLRSLRGLL